MYFDASLLVVFLQKSPPLVARYVPFAAVAAANCVNVPMMRQQEVLSGITVCDSDGKELGKSQVSQNESIIFRHDCIL